MFQFSPLASFSLFIQERMTEHDPRRVSPFGHPRITAYVRLPEAFRSLSRPSSPVHAKASTVRPYSLDRISLPGPLPLRYASLSVLLLPSLYPCFQSTKVLGCASKDVRPVSDFRLRRAYSPCSRKEVIQPQVPLRLPCYDFAPVTELAFGRSPPCGLSHGLRALPTPMA
jgi:hypothetical protein